MAVHRVRETLPIHKREVNLGSWSELDNKTSAVNMYSRDFKGRSQ